MPILRFPARFWDASHKMGLERQKLQGPTKIRLTTSSTRFPELGSSSAKMMKSGQDDPSEGRPRPPVKPIQVDSYVHKVIIMYVVNYQGNREPMQLPGVFSASLAHGNKSYNAYPITGARINDAPRIICHIQSHGKSASSTLVQVKYPIPPPSRPTSISR